MKSSIALASSLLATLALATPLDKRVLYTEYDYETVTVTVTGSGGRGWGGWRSKPTAVVVTSEVVPAQSTAVAEASVVSIPAWSSAAPVVSSVAASVVPTVVSSVVSSSAAAATQDSNVSGYAAPILKQHNLHRANHSASDLVWDDSLAAIAQEVASSCNFAHNTAAGGGGYGQNIGAGTPDNEIDAMITNSMYNNEIGFYPGYGSEPDMSSFENWGHFSQIVWASTTSVGCATVHCSSGLGGVSGGVPPYFTVCNYKPAGNFGGQYAANVKAPSGGATVTI